MWTVGSGEEKWLIDLVSTDSTACRPIHFKGVLCCCSIPTLFTWDRIGAAVPTGIDRFTYGAYILAATLADFEARTKAGNSLFVLLV